MSTPTLSELQDMRAKLIRARMSGLRRLQDQNGEEIEYKTDSEMDRALRNLDAQIAALQSGGSVNVIKFSTSKGLD